MSVLQALNTISEVALMICDLVQTHLKTFFNYLFSDVKEIGES